MLQPSSLALKMSKINRFIQNYRLRPSQVILRTFKSEQKPSPKLKFNVGGLEKVETDSSWQTWLVNLEGRRAMATWVGFGGTLGVLIGRLTNNTYLTIPCLSVSVLVLGGHRHPIP